MKRSSVALRLRKGAWAAEEDILLRKCIEKYGEGKWHQVPQKAGLNRCRKSCRLRWLNYLRPNIKRGEFTVDEVDLMVRLHKLLGNRWSLIAGRLPGRTANDVKNYWNSHLQKKLDADSRLATVKNSESKKEVLLIEPKTNCLSCACHNNILIKPHPRTFSKKTSVSLGTQSSDEHKNNDNNNTTNNIDKIQPPQLVPPPARVPVSDEWWTKLLEETTIDHDNQDQIDGEEFALGDLMLDDSTPQTIFGVQDLGQTGWTDIWNLLNAE